MLFGFQNAVEGLRDQVAFERVEFRRCGGRVAGGDGESVDEFEDEESRECAAEVADALEEVSKMSVSIQRGLEGRT